MRAENKEQDLVETIIIVGKNESISIDYFWHLLSEEHLYATRMERQERTLFNCFLLVAIAKVPSIRVLTGEALKQRYLKTKVSLR